MDEKLRELFADNLKWQLERNHKSQADMCAYMQVSSATGSDWVNGNKMPRVDKIQSLANWLHCRLSDLLEEPDKNAPSYYLDPAVADMAQQAYDDPDTRLLLDAKRDLSEEDLDTVVSLIKRLKKDSEQGGDY